MPLAQGRVWSKTRTIMTGKHYQHGWDDQENCCPVTLYRLTEPEWIETGYDHRRGAKGEGKQQQLDGAIYVVIGE